MKLLRYGQPGQEKPGILDADGTIRDLSSVVVDIGGATLSANALGKLRDVDLSALPAVGNGVRYGPCVGECGEVSVYWFEL